MLPLGLARSLRLRWLATLRDCEIEERVLLCGNKSYSIIYLVVVTHSAIHI